MESHEANALEDAPTLSNAGDVVGPDETVTLQETIRTGPGHLTSEPVSASDSERYRDTQRLLGAGGMGTVELVRDDKIGREVALKLMAKHSRDDAAARARFLREARIQGCLEHPAIVPVYDVGAGADGPFFTMKRVRGQSLSQVLGALRDGKRVAFSRRKLLDTLSQVAVAAHYAHDRGVVHRDIKPANIMLGPYGEVYLIDWGVAKVLGEDEELGQAPAHGQIATGATEHGEVIGSLVTMAPEQITGEPVDARTDVYALGAVLFELLTLRPLHPRGSFDDVAQAIVAGVDARPSVRTPEANVPPELEALCVSATRRVPSERTASALAFSEAIEAFLDSENDEQLRRLRSEEHAAKGKHYAEQVMTLAPAPKDDVGTQEASLRSHALREVGRALALNPSNHAALSTFVQLLTTPPRVVPEEVRLAQRAALSKRLKIGGLAIMVSEVVLMCCGLPLFLLDTRDSRWITLALALFLASGIAGFVTHLRPSYAPLFASAVFSLAGCVVAATATATFTPVIPALVVAQTLGYSMATPRWFRLGILGFAGTCWTAIIYGPSLGLLPKTARILDGDLVLHSPALAFDPTWFTLWTFTSVFAMAVAIGLSVVAQRTASQRAADQQQLQAWQLRQLVANGPI
jgi:eukaryotic-like serine/threonine-protein kinase